ncbi:MAG TPA: hypothetical protein VG737_18220 [Cyclobacteriaceae bacterium]|nr:hypothetical protein [Cyclobacteriaceae bacterium]
MDTLSNRSKQNKLPETYETLTTLADKVLKAHAVKGNNSPLGEILALQINVKLELARQRHDEALQSPLISDKMFAQRDAILGIRSDADLEQGGTLKFYLQCAADILANDKNALKEFGFKV